MADQEQLDGFLAGLEATASRAKSAALRQDLWVTEYFHNDAKPELVASRIGQRSSYVKVRTSTRGIHQQGMVASNHTHLVYRCRGVGYPTGSVH
jgi:hypothetical protein